MVTFAFVRLFAHIGKVVSKEYSQFTHKPNIRIHIPFMFDQTQKWNHCASEVLVKRVLETLLTKTSLAQWFHFCVRLNMNGM